RLELTTLAPNTYEGAGLFPGLMETLTLVQAAPTWEGSEDRWRRKPHTYVDCTMHRRGIIFVLSAPSGAGKTSISKRIVAAMPDVVQVVTCTTRAPRPGERDGREYHFLSRQAFEQRIAAGDFLEWAQFNGQLYGTLRQSVEAATAAGK